MTFLPAFPPSCRRVRMGFTLIELLVVVAILAMLMTALLPAVQMAREAARRTTCSNNLRQIALGCLQHHDQQGFFPSGGWGSCWVGDPDLGFGKNQPGSWAFSILPSIEQTPLFMLASDGDPDSVSATQQQNANTVCNTPLPVFICPSRRSAISYPTSGYQSLGQSLRNASSPSTANRSDYKMNGGSVRVMWDTGPSLSDGLAGNGFTSMDGTTGLVAQRSEIQLAHVRDGASSTYLLGEKYLNPIHYTTGLDSCDDTSLFAGSDADTVGWTGESNAWTPLTRPAQDKAGTFNPVTFGSAHPNGCIMAMADGSTHTIGYDVDPNVHMLRGNRNDRTPTPPP